MQGRLLLETSVHAEWVDYNGHMNDACYALVFSRALDGFIEQIGLVDILPSLKEGDSYSAHPGIEPE